MKGKIFNAQEVQAIIAGNKTQFREVCLFQPTNELAIDALLRLYKPYGIGQKIFCKEVFCKSIFGKAIYKDEEKEIRGFGGKEVVVKWKPAQHMKQEHSRLTLEITSIKVERLAEISKEDAIKEGATSRPNCHGYANRYEGWCMNWNKVGEASKWASNRTLSESDVCMGSAQYAFGNFWNATHRKPKEKFEANPFVWVVDFKINK